MPITRSSSPWICAFMPLGPSSRMNLAIFLALAAQALLDRASTLYTLPDAGSGLARLEGLERDAALDELFLEHFDAASRAPRTRPDHAALLAAPPIVAPAPRKSNRVDSSLFAWFSGVVHLLAVDLAHDVERGIARHVTHLVVSAVGLAHLATANPGDRASKAFAILLLGRVGPAQAGFPSGQRDLTVNQTAHAYGGSNPSPATRRNAPPTWEDQAAGRLSSVRGCLCVGGSAWVARRTLTHTRRRGSPSPANRPPLTTPARRRPTVVRPPAGRPTPTGSARTRDPRRTARRAGDRPPCGTAARTSRACR